MHIVAYAPHNGFGFGQLYKQYWLCGGFAGGEFVTVSSLAAASAEVASAAASAAAASVYKYNKKRSEFLGSFFFLAKGHMMMYLRVA